MNKIKDLLKIFFTIIICFSTLGTDGENKDDNMNSGGGIKRNLEGEKEERIAKKAKTTIESFSLNDLCNQSPCYLARLPNEILCTILCPDLKNFPRESQFIFYTNTQTLMNVRCTSKYFMEIINDCRLRNVFSVLNLFKYTTSHSSNFTYISRVFPNMKKLSLCLDDDMNNSDDDMNNSFDFFKKLTHLTRLNVINPYDLPTSPLTTQLSIS